MAADNLRIEMFDGPRPAEKIVVLEGVLNAETAFRFRDAVRGADSATLVIDLTGVRSMDSSGLGVLIGMYASRERTSRRLLLAGLNDRIWELFRICRIADVFTRYPNVAAAEQAVPLEAEDIASPVADLEPSNTAQ
jgi:anti-sigma B factor antagonist